MAAFQSAPLILGAENKSQSKRPVVGQGDYLYECYHDWGDLPVGAAYGHASHGVAFDSEGLLYVTHHGKPGSIFVFDSDGRFVRFLGDVHVRDGSGFGHGIDIRNENGQDFLYLSANDPRLSWAKMTIDGELIWTKYRPKESGRYKDPETPCIPTNISFMPDGGYFLGDGYGSHYIHQYDAKDQYIRTIGGFGSGKGQFKTPHGHWLDDRDGTPKLVVADRANARLQYLSLDGEHLAFLEGLLFPADIDIQGDIMVVPDLYCRITLFDKDNQVLAQLGEDVAWRERVLASNKTMRAKPKEWKQGIFVHPHDAVFDTEGNIFVAEWVENGRLTKLRHLS